MLMLSTSTCPRPVWRPVRRNGTRFMNVLDFEKVVRSEKTAMHYVLTRCSMVGDFRCPGCSCDKLYEVEGAKRRRCSRCGHTFNPFAGRYLNDVKLSAHEWLWLIKLFELDTSATVIADETGISYPTILKAIDTIRRAIAASNLTGREILADCEEALQLAISAAPDHDDGSFGAEPVPDRAVFLLLRLGDDCLIMTRESSPHGYIRCGDRKLDVVDHGKSFPRLKVYCSAKGFWPFAKERLIKYHGVSLDKLPWYLEEMSFRWMNRKTPLFDLILEHLCRYAPRPDDRGGAEETRRGFKRRIRSMQEH